MCFSNLAATIRMIWGVNLKLCALKIWLGDFGSHSAEQINLRMCFSNVGEKGVREAAWWENRSLKLGWWGEYSLGKEQIAPVLAHCWLLWWFFLRVRLLMQMRRPWIWAFSMKCPRQIVICPDLSLQLFVRCPRDTFITWEGEGFCGCLFAWAKIKASRWQCCEKFPIKEGAAEAYGLSYA